VTDVVRCAVEGTVAVVTLDRPEARNAISVELQRQLWNTVQELGEDCAIGAVVLTGTDPAFCAGVDLRELAATIAPSPATLRDQTAARSTDSTASPNSAASPDSTASPNPAASPDSAASQDSTKSSQDSTKSFTPDAPTRFGDIYRYLPPIAKPIIAAVNGPCVTGGLELALQCSFIVASERARFADTHARVGVMPGGGMSIYLAEAVGFRRAREMSLTGNYVDAAEARQIGLVNHVVPHEQLLPFAVGLARDMAGTDPTAVGYLLGTYDEAAALSAAQGAAVERRRWRGWQNDGSEIDRRRVDIVARGRHQIEQ